jgi:benzoyl-CoA 2,3-dioxygenase component A
LLLISDIALSILSFSSMLQEPSYLRQHLIDPAVCIRCNTCLESCPESAIQFDGANYIVDATICNDCGKCKPDCPTGAIDNYRLVPREAPYSLADQSGWEVLPEQGPLADGVVPDIVHDAGPGPHVSVAPWSATKAATMLFPPAKPVAAKIKSNLRLTAEDAENDIRHIVLDFGEQPHGLLEGQTLAVVPPGTGTNGQPHHLRNYSVASTRHGETAGSNDVAFTVKRVVEAQDNGIYRGIASNYLCDARPGDPVQCVGPFGNAFLLPLHPGAKLLMICVGTGVAPFRSFIQHRQRHPQPATGPWILLYGGRSPQEMAYHDELGLLPASLVDVRFAYSRLPEHPKTYVHDLLLHASQQVASLLDDTETYIYICGLRAMENGVMSAFETICTARQKNWSELRKALQEQGRLHIETY